MLIAWAATRYVYFIFTKFIDKCTNDSDKQFCAFLAMLWPITLPMSIVYLIIKFTSILLSKGLK